MHDLDARLAAIEDREKIREAAAAYSQNIVAGEAFRNAELFTDDGVFHIDSIRLRVEGKASLAALFGRMRPGTSFPFIHGHMIQLAGDEATHTCTMENRGGDEGESGYGGIYLDRLRRVAGRWLFVDRGFTFHKGQPPPIAPIDTDR